ncbi:hypothetical protein L3Y34_014796 [Caenorhabditis briggsae]|nr:hypothetical protein L3Y34_014796 [Caenorhabditis briggsae]
MSLLDDSRDDSYAGDEYGGDLSYPYQHEQPPPYAVHQCNVCNKIFMNYKGLQQHSVIHTDTKPFLCEVCGRGFRFKSNMFEHRTVHTGYTPHLCPFCGKQFRLKGNMKKHMRTHVTNKEELEAAYRPYSRFAKRNIFLFNRRQTAIIPENALVIRGSPVPYFPVEKRRMPLKLSLGTDSSDWVNLIRRNKLLPMMALNEKLLRANMRLGGPITFYQMIENSKPLELEMFHCPICKCECAGKEICEEHMYVSHGRKPEDFLDDSRYCYKCMRMFVDKEMYDQHNSYHGRVHMMIANRELENNTVPPEVDMSQCFYNMLANHTNDLVVSKPSSPSIL